MNNDAANSDTANKDTANNVPGDAEADHRAVEQYRAYLLLLARMQLNARPPGGLEASDVVQQTLLEGFAQRRQFTCDEAGFAAWLRKALTNNIRDALRHTQRKKRDVNRQRSLDADSDQSAARLAACLAAAQSSPSQQAVKNEELLRLADALLTLPEAQRETIVLHHLQGWTLAETAAQLGRTDAAVAGLLHRGLRGLRERMRTADRETPP